MRCLECNSLARKRPNKDIYICVGCGETYTQLTLFGEGETFDEENRTEQGAKKANA